jgi:hypothetical protein
MPGLKLLRPSGAALCVALLVMALAGVAGQVDAATAPIKLVAEVGPGFTITLKKAGKRVVTLKRGQLRRHGQGSRLGSQLPPGRARRQSRHPGRARRNA